MSVAEQQALQNTQIIESSETTGPTRIVSDRLGIYYSNCAMVVLSPKEVSLFLGRYTSIPAGNGKQNLGELYERQVYMTIEHAEDLVKVLSGSIQDFKAFKLTEAENNSLS